MTERIILAMKLYPKMQPGLGMIQPVAEEVDGELVPLTKENFCKTGQVFVGARYEEIDQKFRISELFRIPVSPAFTSSERESAFRAYGQNAEKLGQSEIAEVIMAELPDRNDRRLNLDCFPATPYIFIQNAKNECYGPLDWEPAESGSGSADITLKLITGGGLGNAGRSKLITKLREGAVKELGVTCATPSGERLFIKSIVTAINSGSFYEYANNKEIIEYVKSIAGDNANRIIDKRTTNQLAQIASNKNPTQFAKSRIALFLQIVDEGLSSNEVIGDFFDGYLKGPRGADVLEDFVQKNRARYIDQLRKEREVETGEVLQKKREELAAVEESLDKTRYELQQTIDALAEKRRELEEGVLADTKTYLEKVSAEIYTEIDALNKEKNACETRLAELRASVGNLERVEAIELRITEKNGVLNFLDDKVRIARVELEATQDLCHKSSDELTKKLREQKLLGDYVNGLSLKGNIVMPEITASVVESAHKEAIQAQRAIIETVQSNLAASARSMDDWEVANLLISTQQSFITFLAGLPGVGKTSLCRLLAQSQGVDKRLHNISVARGWTAIKDMVGFHNPLTDRFQPSNTGLYGFLKALDAEAKLAATHYPMSYVLLDEANLSPIEHYWSSFMTMSDDPMARTLLVGEEQINIPKSLRFLATINYDGTTEPLSSRVLDRAAVIVMSPDSLSECATLEKTLTQALPVSTATMDALFGLAAEVPALEYSELNAFQAINDVLKDTAGDKGRPIHISPRKVLAIRHYCHRARPIMNASKGEMMAMDLAVCQHILPQVRGNGAKFGKRLDELRRKFEEHSLENAGAYLDQMIAFGQTDLHSYDFFCW